jgi:hypothetical protein
MPDQAHSGEFAATRQREAVVDRCDAARASSADRGGGEIGGSAGSMVTNTGRPVGPGLLAN